MAQSTLDHPERYRNALSRLLAYQTFGDPKLLDGLPLDPRTVERLAGLGMDGICKTVWFLGHCLSEIGNYSIGHGRKKPCSIEVELMAERAFQMLKNWPDSLGKWLDDLLSSQFEGKFSATSVQYLLAPLQHYLQADASPAELRFLSAALEQHLKRVWVMMGSHHHRCRFERQLELGFDT